MNFQSDQEVIESWLYGKRPHTLKAYQYRIAEFMTFVDKPLKDITLPNLQRFQESLHGALNTQRLTINVVRSLFTFAFKEGYLDKNTAASKGFHPPKATDRLSERMLTEEEVHAIINAASKHRDRVFIRLLYLTGVRVSELCSLQWGDVRKSKKSTQITVMGKGMKNRTIRLSQSATELIETLRGNAKPNDPVFRSQKCGHLDPSQAWRIVRAAASQAGIDKDVSPHWFRHSHASHALEKGVNPALVRDTLGHSNLSITDRYVHSNPNDSSGMYLDA